MKYSSYKSWSISDWKNRKPEKRKKKKKKKLQFIQTKRTMSMTNVDVFVSLFCFIFFILSFVIFFWMEKKKKTILFKNENSVPCLDLIKSVQFIIFFYYYRQTVCQHPINLQYFWEIFLRNIKYLNQETSFFFFYIPEM